MKIPTVMVSASAILSLAVPSITIAAGVGTVGVQILAVNDFHGNLAPPAGSSGRVGSINAGGAEYLATHVSNLRALNQNTVVVSAGDLIGASPLLSALFHDEPTIEAFNEIGLDFNAVGNHEFDEGIHELVRMQEGGCHPGDGCIDNDDFAGAEFRFLAANVQWQKNDKTVFPAFKIRSFEGVQVAFIGMTLEGTPSIVSPSGISQLNFLDESDTVNSLIPHLKQRGVEAIVVLIHEGGLQVPSTSPINDCEGITGPIVDIVERMSDEVDVVITGHTHQAYNCQVDGKLVTSALSFGRVVTRIDLEVDRASGEVVSKVADNHIVTRDVTKDTGVGALIQKYSTIAAPLANRVIGSITTDITRLINAAGESSLGDVIADAQLAATTAPGFGEAVVAFMNPGGIRADLAYSGSAAGEGDGNVTFEEMFTVQPFGNSLVTMTLAGSEIETLLEQQFVGCGQSTNRILQVSFGFTYQWKQSGPACDKVDPSSIRLDGIMVVPSGRYRVTVNSFLAHGGDNFSVLTQGTSRLGGEVDTDAFEKYFKGNSPVSPGAMDRILVLP